MDTPAECECHQAKRCIGGRGIFGDRVGGLGPGTSVRTRVTGGSALQQCACSAWSGSEWGVAGFRCHGEPRNFRARRVTQGGTRFDTAVTAFYV